MNSNRKAAVITGILFIIGTAAGVTSAVLTAPIFAGEDLLARVFAQQNRILLAGMFVLVMGFALAMVPAVMYPILKKQDRALALGYLVFRGALETGLCILTVSAWMFLAEIGREAVRGGAAGWDYNSLGAMILKVNANLSNLLVIVFSAGAVLLYVMLYRARLLPRWISVWGLIAIGLHFTTAMLMIFAGVDPAADFLTLMNLPIMLQEMVMAGWMIARGFNASSPVLRQAEAG